MGAFGNMIRRVAATSAGSNVSSYINADGSVKENQSKKIIKSKQHEKATKIKQ